MIGIGAGIGISRMRDLAALIRAMLFGSGEVGVMYDPGDLTTMSQDSAGTVAAAIEQPVGLLLDKSKGLVLGAELVTNGGFADGTGWTPGTGWTIGSGVASVVAASGTVLRQAKTITAGKAYQIQFDITSYTAGTLYAQFATAGSQAGQNFTSAGTKSCIIIANANYTNFDIGALAGTTASVDNISVRELPGYHATQSTSTARGILGTSLIDLDGVDDSYTAAAGGGGSTGFFLCAAVRVDGGDGTERVIYSDAGTNTGYILRLNTSNQLELAAGNGTAYTLAATTDTLTAGPYVVTAWDDGTNLNVQVNSGTAGTAARPVVSAGNAGFRIGKDYGAATGFFNGAIYQMVYVKNGENVDAADRASVKTYVASKAGVTL